MSRRIALFVAGLVAALALPVAKAAARGGHWHGGGGYGGGYRGGSGLHIGPPATLPPPVIYAPPPVYAPPPLVFGGSTGNYLPPAGGADGGYNR